MTWTAVVKDSPRRRPVPASLVAVAVLASLALINWSADAAGATPPTTTTSAPSTTTSSTTTSTTAAPGTTSTTVKTFTTVPTSSIPPPTIPPPGVSITDLQLNAINAQFLTEVEAEVGSAQAAFTASQAALAEAGAVANAAAATLAREHGRLGALNQAQQAAAASVQRARFHLRDFAVAAYESGGPGGPLAALLSAQTIGDFARREAYFATIADDNAAALTEYEHARGATSHATLVTVDDLQKAQAAKQLADEQLVLAAAAEQQAKTEFADRQALLTLTSDAISTPNTDIPRMVLDAYQRAAASVQAQGCQLQWWGLAGIGRVESDQGRAENAHLTPTGDLVPHIIGVPLTGEDGTALIESGGEYAHAEGPMQFIPSTWAIWGRDAIGDGNKDVDNIYDAALGAAAYLCATSTALDTDPGLEAAYLSYNHSQDYVTEVLAYAHSYEEAQVDGLIPPMAPEPLYTLAPTTTTTTPATGVTTTVP
jgi:membrane-bound lytic murein transglycosylase B